MKRFILILVILFLSNIEVFPQTLYKEAPNFNLETYEGERINLADFKDKSVLLFFWTTQCPYCRSAIPKLNLIYYELKNLGIEILGINLGESSYKVKRFLEKYPIYFKILLDKEATTVLSYGILGVPTYVFIDKEGLIRFKENYFPFDDYKKIIKELSSK
ncbi:MAG: TlpA family protein disulfide reductase [Candidatus Omnitrophica bacterium]|nr:TlpA family protein disulfide reductase [Candidatus Omnitrophota bacterium]